MEQRKDRRASNSKRNQMEVQPTRSTSLWRSMGMVGEKLQESSVFSVWNRSVSKDFLSTTMYFVKQTLNARPLTPVSSDVNDFEALNPNHFLLSNKSVCLPYLPCAEKFVYYRNILPNSNLCESNMGQIVYRISANTEQQAEMAIYGERNP